MGLDSSFLEDQFWLLKCSIWTSESVFLKKSRHVLKRRGRPKIEIGHPWMDINSSQATSFGHNYDYSYFFALNHIYLKWFTNIGSYMSEIVGFKGRPQDLGFWFLAIGMT